MISDPSLEREPPNQIFVLPIQDQRLDKEDKVNLQKAVSKAAARSLRYYKFEWEEVSEVRPGSGDGSISEAELAAPSAEWISALGPEGSRWILILGVRGVQTEVIIGARSTAVVHGYLFDKQAGKVVWEDEETGSWAAGIAFAWQTDDTALGLATAYLLETFPSRRKR